MSFPQTIGQCFHDRLELEFVETPAGDVYAFAVVSDRGELVRCEDEDGHPITLTPTELVNVLRRVEERRADMVGTC